MAPFQQLRVLDLSTVLAGPSVAMFFAELGAEVIKIENPRTKGDVTRTWKLPSETPDNPVSAYFSSVNYQKEYQWHDLSDPESMTIVRELIASADVLITNFKEGDDVKFGLTANELRALNPGLIHGKISGFTSDPGRVAYDVVLQAETGFMYMNGTPESGPVKMPVALIDVLAAHQLKEGILCALLERERTGHGSTVTCSLEDAGISSLFNQASNYLMTGHIAQRIGSAHPNIAPYGDVFSCSDQKQVVLAIGSDRQFRDLCAILGEENLAYDERFSMNSRRVKNRTLLCKSLVPLFAQYPREYWMNAFRAANIPAGSVRSMDEVISGTAAQNLIREELIDGIPTRRLSSVAFKIAQH